MGGNLIRKPNQVLINSLASGDVAVSSGVLRIKQYGNDITLANVLSFTKIENTAGTLKVSQVQIKPVYPSTVADGWEGGIEVKKNYQLTGDPQDFYGLSKSATYSLENFLTASSGYLNPLDCVEIAGNIVEQVNNDPDAIVTAELKVYIAYTAQGTLAVTDLSGNSLLDTTTYADVATAVTGLNAISGLTAVADSTDGLYLSASEGLIITGETSKFDVTLAYVVYTQAYANKPFSLLPQNVGGKEVVNTAYVKEVLPLTEVQRVFPILPGQIAATPNIPLADTAYTKCIFKILHTDGSGMVAANRREDVIEDVEFFLPTTVAQGAYWSDIFYDDLVNLGLYTVTYGATTLTLTGASGAGAGTMSVVDVPGLTVSSVKYYAGASNSGTINVTTGVVASGTDADVFYAEIKYAHLDYSVVSQITCTAVATGTFSGTMLTDTTILAYEYLGRWDLVTNSSGLGTPVLRTFNATVQSQSWAFDSGDTGVCDSLIGAITTAGANTDVITSVVAYVGKTSVTSFEHTWLTGQINSQTIVSVAV